LRQPAYARRVSANVAFSLCAGVASLLIVGLAGAKGDWAVAVVYAMLVIGFAARAALGRHRRSEEPGPPPPPRHPDERRLRHARFRRR
jgi:hypothetical protein